MGQYDDINPDTLRDDLRCLAKLILQLESNGQLLEATPLLLRLLGDLRAKLFAYEVRFTGRLIPEERDDPGLLDARRIVQEAIQRERDARHEWSRHQDPEMPPE